MGQFVAALRATALGAGLSLFTVAASVNAAEVVSPLLRHTGSYQPNGMRFGGAMYHPDGYFVLTLQPVSRSNGKIVTLDDSGAVLFESLDPLARNITGPIGIAAGTKESLFAHGDSSTYARLDRNLRVRNFGYHCDITTSGAFEWHLLPNGSVYCDRYSPDPDGYVPPRVPNSRRSLIRDTGDRIFYKESRQSQPSSGSWSDGTLISIAWDYDANGPVVRMVDPIGRLTDLGINYSAHGCKFLNVPIGVGDNSYQLPALCDGFIAWFDKTGHIARKANVDADACELNTRGNLIVCEGYSESTVWNALTSAELSRREAGGRRSLFLGNEVIVTLNNSRLDFTDTRFNWIAGFAIPAGHDGSGIRIESLMPDVGVAVRHQPLFSPDRFVRTFVVGQQGNQLYDSGPIPTNADESVEVLLGSGGRLVVIHNCTASSIQLGSCQSRFDIYAL